MSALGHKRTFPHVYAKSALPPKADMCGAPRDVCFGPIADIEGLSQKRSDELAPEGDPHVTTPAICLANASDFHQSLSAAPGTAAAVSELSERCNCRKPYAADSQGACNGSPESTKAHRRLPTIFPMANGIGLMGEARKGTWRRDQTRRHRRLRS
jgi:hypothetical protein